MSHNFRRNVLVALGAIFGTAIAMVPWTQRAQAQTGPSLVTDHTAYKAGETVTIFGSGFAPNESVNLQVVHSNGRHEPGGGHERVSLLADGTGAFTAIWSINVLDSEGNSFKATAGGRSSGDAPPAEFRRIATVETDKYDYRPGDTVLIRGAGFLPNEQVTLQVLHLSGLSNGSSDYPFNTYADSTGHITSTWLVNEADRDSILTLTAAGSNSGLKALTIFTDLLVSIPDDGGADDATSQVDVNKLTQDDQNFPTTIATTWQWDDTGWPGGNSGNICGLFDIDHDQFGNFAVCVAVKNNPAEWFQTSVYSCSDKDARNCTNPVLLESWGGGGTGTDPNPCTATVVAGADPFAHGNGNVCNGTDCKTADTVATCTIPRTFPNAIGGTAALWASNASSPFLINVCSEPSNEPNSNPADCVIIPTQGFLKIIKNDEEQNDSTLFTFTTNPASGHDGNTFQVNGSGTAHSTLTNQTVISFGPQSGTLTLTESIPAGWAMDSPNTGCVITDANNIPHLTGSVDASTGAISQITITTGLTTTCTFSNKKLPGTLKVVKVVTNDNGGTKGVTDFSFSVSNGVASNVFFEADGENQFTVNEGNYTVTENAVTGYTPSYSNCTSVHVPAGGSATCTITNNDDAASLKLVKRIVNDNGGTKVVGNFGITTSAGALTFGAGTADGANTLKYTSNTITGLSAGTAYTLHEDTVTGYTEGTWSCDVGTVNSNAQSGSVTLANGQSATCTITNNDRPPSLTLRKIVLNDNGGPATPDMWTLKADGTGQNPTNLSGPGPTASSGPNFQADTYNLSETGIVPWYTNGTAWNCVKNGQTLNGVTAIQLAGGDTATCTITNDDIAPRLTLVKTVTNDSGGTATPADWTLRATGPITISGVSGSAAVTNAAVSAGNYTLSENGLVGYTASLYSCVVNGGEPVSSNSLSLALGDTATCTINNHNNPARMPLTKKVNGHTLYNCVADPQTHMATCNQDSAQGPQVTVHQYTFNLYDQLTQNDPDYPNTPYDLDPGAGYIPATLDIPPDIEIPARLNTPFTLCEMGEANGTLGGDGLPAGWVSIWTVNITDANGKSLSSSQAGLSGPFPAPDNSGRSCINFTLPTAASGGTIAITINNTQMGRIIVDKVTDPPGDPTVFSFQATGTGYLDFQLADATPPNNQTLIAGSYGVRELPLTNWKVTNIVCVNTVGTVSTFRVIGSGGQPNSTFDMGDDRVQIELAPAETVTCTFTNVDAAGGRMTGGGSINPGRGTRVTHGFEVHCDPSVLPNNLEINWQPAGQRQIKFHLDSLTTAQCTDNPIKQNPPAAGFDTFTGTGTGSVNGVPGYSIVFTFTDAGEPGTGDFALYLITGPASATCPNGVCLSASGTLTKGNHQAHVQ